MWLQGDRALSGPRQGGPETTVPSGGGGSAGCPCRHRAGPQLGQVQAVARQLGEVLVQVEPAAVTFGGPGGFEPPPGPVRERLSPLTVLYLLVHVRVSNERQCRAVWEAGWVAPRLGPPTSTAPGPTRLC